jgi:predicted SnoaL-like aldol condensation-catalyzing enzyme
MPLLADLPVTGQPAAWDFIHIWRVADGMLVEHWACRDDHGMIERLRSR